VDPELEQAFTDTRARIYNSLEKDGPKEDDMGIFQKLDILEYRTVGLGEQLERRKMLQERQAEIEAHPLFIRRPPKTKSRTR
jgi:hypothetical protein